MSETKRIFMAALHGLTNMGMAIPETRELRDVRQGVSDGRMNFQDAVDRFCAGYYENEEHQRIFTEEAQSWYDRKDLLDNMLPRMKKAWGDSFPKRWETALTINEGAVNLIPIAMAIADATREVNDEHGNSHTDPAIRIMAHQLAHLTEVGAVMDMQDYNACMETIQENVIAVKKLRDGE